MSALVRPAGVAGPRSPVWQDTCVPALALPFRVSGHTRASAWPDACPGAPPAGCAGWHPRDLVG
eukprot:5876505-Alexandrium_andersonii.AAC.1